MHKQKMASSSLYLVISVLMMGQVFCQYDEDFDYDNPLPPFRPVAEPDQTVQACVNKKMDIYFLLDSSTSIYILDYRRVIDFTKEIVNRLDISSSDTRVGVLTFSDQVNERSIELNSYSNKAELLSNINEQTLPYRTGITNTDQAIRYVRENREFRQDITKVIVVVTDGGSRSPLVTAREADLARDQGFYLFVIGVGQYLDETEWQAIATDPDSSFIYNITNFQFLDNVKFSLPNRACALPPLLVGTCRVTYENFASLYYVANGRVQDFAYQLSTNFVDRTNGQSTNLRVGYIFDNCNEASNVGYEKPESYCTRYAPNNNDPFTDVLARAVTAATESREERGDHSQVAVLFIDDDALRFNPEQVRGQIQSLENNSVEVIVVDFSRRGAGASLQSLLPRRENYVRFLNNILGQEQTHKTLIERTCSALKRGDEPVTPPSEK